MADTDEINDPERDDPTALPRRPRRSLWQYLPVMLLTAVVTFGVTALLVSIFTRKTEQRTLFVRLVEVNEQTTDPEVWKVNWPREYDGYARTVDATRTRYGGSEAMPAQKLERDPWLKRMFSGYAFSIDYRDRRGHAYMLFDQTQTERVTNKPQPGACLHCHASIVPTWRRVGAGALGQPVAADDFQWPAVLKGFEVMSTMRYTDAFAELTKTGGGAAGASVSSAQASPNQASTTPTTRESLAAHATGNAHPVSCVDCHNPRTLELRVTRPGFVRGIQALARSSAPVPHLPSIERWRQGGRTRDYDPNTDATRQEMRSFACGQCHVEYYCGPKETLFFPWDNGLRVDDIEKTYEAHKFPDGSPFADWVHGETGAPVYKAQHPEFELWSQGVHARSGVACADCHMPYVREGAMKVSDHWVRSPMLMVNRSCQTCHNFPESELTARVAAIQDRTHGLIGRASAALTDMLDAIRSAQAAGATAEQQQQLFKLQRQAQWRLDFISSENSTGFHASQETARVLGESIDYARQAQVLAVSIRAPKAPPSTRQAAPVEGVTPAENAPPAPYRPLTQ